MDTCTSHVSNSENRHVALVAGITEHLRNILLRPEQCKRLVYRKALNQIKKGHASLLNSIILNSIKYERLLGFSHYVTVPVYMDAFYVKISAIAQFIQRHKTSNTIKVYDRIQPGNS